MKIDKKIEERELPEGYGINKGVLIVRDPETLFAYWEVGRQEQERMENSLGDRNSGLVLRLAEITHCPSKIHCIPISKNFIGSYYLKREHGVKPNHRYSLDIGFLLNKEYMQLVPSSNIVETPRDRESRNHFFQLFNSIKKQIEETKFEKLRNRISPEIVRKEYQRLQEDKKNKHVFHNYS
jgi:hypothetical protein